MPVTFSSKMTIRLQFSGFSLGRAGELEINAKSMESDSIVFAQPLSEENQRSVNQGSLFTRTRID